MLFSQNKGTQKVVGLVVENFFNGFSIIINLILEIINGNMNHDQCKKCFEHNDVVLNFCNSTGSLDLVKYEIKDKFELSYMGVYAVEDVDVFKEEVNELKNGSLEYYMNKLSLIMECDEKLLDNVSNSFVQKQLKELGSLYEMNNPQDKTYEITSNFISFTTSNRKIELTKIELTKIKSYLDRLIYDVHPSLKYFLETFQPPAPSLDDVNPNNPKKPRKYFVDPRIFPASHPIPESDENPCCPCNKRVRIVAAICSVLVITIIISVIIVVVVLVTSSKILIKRSLQRDDEIRCIILRKFSFKRDFFYCQVTLGAKTKIIKDTFLEIF